jgi:hypothetical protein
VVSLKTTVASSFWEAAKYKVIFFNCMVFIHAPSQGWLIFPWFVVYIHNWIYFLVKIDSLSKTEKKKKEKKKKKGEEEEVKEEENYLEYCTKTWSF